MGRFAGKHTLVAGGAPGIGAASLAAFFKEGAKVSLSWLTSSEAAAAIVAGAPQRCFAVSADTTQPYAVVRLFDAAQTCFGPIYVLFANVRSLVARQRLADMAEQH